MTDANEEPRWLAAVSLISSFVAVQWRGKGRGNVGEQPAACLCFCLSRCSHTHAHTGSYTTCITIDSILSYCDTHTVPLHVPRALQQFPGGHFNHACRRIDLYFLSVSGPWIVCRSGSSGERCTLGNSLRLNGPVGNPTSLRLDEGLWIFACDG